MSNRLKVPGHGGARYEGDAAVPTRTLRHMNHYHARLGLLMNSPRVWSNARFKNCVDEPAAAKELQQSVTKSTTPHRHLGAPPPLT
jgi:hypothetical protein